VEPKRNRSRRSARAEVSEAVIGIGWKFEVRIL